MLTPSPSEIYRIYIYIYITIDPARTIYMRYRLSRGVGAVVFLPYTCARVWASQLRWFTWPTLSYDVVLPGHDGWVGGAKGTCRLRVRRSRQENDRWAEWTRRVQQRRAQAGIGI